MNRFIGFLSLVASVLYILGLGLVSGPIAHAALSIGEDYRPEYAPQGWMEVFGGDVDAEQTFGPEAISYILADIIVVLLQIAGALAIYFIVTSGFNYVKAFGREEELQKAKKGLTWAIIGFIVVILSYMIVQNIIKIVLTVDDDGSSTSYIEGTETVVELA